MTPIYRQLHRLTGMQAGQPASLPPASPWLPGSDSDQVISLLQTPQVRNADNSIISIKSNRRGRVPSTSKTHIGASFYGLARVGIDLKGNVKATHPFCHLHTSGGRVLWTLSAFKRTFLARLVAWSCALFCLATPIRLFWNLTCESGTCEKWAGTVRNG